MESIITRTCVVPENGIISYTLDVKEYERKLFYLKLNSEPSNGVIATTSCTKTIKFDQMENESPNEQLIKIELNLTPAIAFLLGGFIATIVQNDKTLLSLMSKSAKEEIFDIAQEILNQVAKKTDFAKLNSNTESTSE